MSAHPPGTILIREGRDPYKGCAIRIVDPTKEGKPIGGPRLPGSVLVRRLRAGDWHFEWMHGALLGWVVVDELPPPAESDQPSPDPARVFAENLAMYIDADPRGPMEIARSIFPEYGHPSTKVDRLRSGDYWPSISDVIDIMAEFGLSSATSLFEDGLTDDISQWSKAELVRALTLLGHTVEVDRVKEAERQEAAIRDRVLPRADPLDDVVLAVVRDLPATVAEIVRAISPPASRWSVSASAMRLSRLGLISQYSEGSRIRWRAVEESSK